MDERSGWMRVLSSIAVMEKIPSYVLVLAFRELNGGRRAICHESVKLSLGIMQSTNAYGNRNSLFQAGVCPCCPYRRIFGLFCC